VGPRRDVGIVFQSPVLLPWLRVLDNVMLPAVVHRLDRRTYEKRAHELIEMIGLTGFEKHFPRELSGGMEQRVALARALCCWTSRSRRSTKSPASSSTTIFSICGGARRGQWCSSRIRCSSRCICRSACL